MRNRNNSINVSEVLNNEVMSQSTDLLCSLRKGDWMFLPPSHLILFSEDHNVLAFNWGIFVKCSTAICKTITKTIPLPSSKFP